MKSQQPKYQFYATLLDAYSDYLHSDIIYQEYWGFSENPPMSEDEFHERKRLELIDRINRVPFDSEAADRGTAFNEIVDWLITGQKSEKAVIENVYANPETYFDGNAGDGYDGKGIVAYKATYNGRTFMFPISICKEFADYYPDSAPQVYVESVIQTNYGDVKLYGYIDELMPGTIHDIKTTTKYTAGKFKHHWQHIVYPYCLCDGKYFYDFEYDVLLINEKKSGDTYETFTEFYNFVPEVDVPRLIAHVERLIEFIEAHKDVITDLKIFNKENHDKNSN